MKFESYENLEQDKHNIWHSPSGAKIAWFKDPDNNILSLTEYYTKIFKTVDRVAE